MEPLYLKTAELRHLLHQNPELSGHEKKTVKIISDFIKTHSDFQLYYPPKGGLIAYRTDNSAGKNLLFRADIDGVKINEPKGLTYASLKKNISHKCGHEGHSAILAGLAASLKGKKSKHKTLIFVFQPAEETGKGAKILCQDHFFKNCKPDVAFGLHNIPGYNLGEIILRPNVFALASTGIEIKLEGVCTHASTPHLGNSPEVVLADLIKMLPLKYGQANPFTMLTITHAVLGNRTFGITPVEARLCFTLRSKDTSFLNKCIDEISDLAQGMAKKNNLTWSLKKFEPFPAIKNSPEAVELVKKSAERLKMTIIEKKEPFSFSDDFAYFTDLFGGAFFGLGSGKESKPLHHPQYDFCDKLIKPGIRILLEIINLYCPKFPSTK
jgi:amidohydrolase